MTRRLAWAVLSIGRGMFETRYLPEGADRPLNTVALCPTGTDAATEAKLLVAKARIDAERAARTPEPVAEQEPLL